MQISCKRPEKTYVPLGTDALGFEPRLPTFEEHGDDFLEVALDLVERCTRRVGPGPAGHIADVDPVAGPCWTTAV